MTNIIKPRVDRPLEFEGDVDLVDSADGATATRTVKEVLRVITADNREVDEVVSIFRC
jgi:hypothetical protein